MILGNIRVHFSWIEVYYRISVWINVLHECKKILYRFVLSYRHMLICFCTIFRHYKIFLRVARHYFAEKEVSEAVERIGEVEWKAMRAAPIRATLH